MSNRNTVISCKSFLSLIQDLFEFSSIISTLSQLSGNLKSNKMIRSISIICNKSKDTTFVTQRKELARYRSILLYVIYKHKEFHRTKYNKLKFSISVLFVVKRIKKSYY